MKNTILLAALLACLTTLSACAAERRVSSAYIAPPPPKPKPWDVIVMSDGAWKDQSIHLKGNGVTLKAQTPGKVSLEGNSRLVIEADHVTVSGLNFVDSQSK